MPRTKEQIAKYNKEYFARPEVKEKAKIRNAKYRQRRKEYKKTLKGRQAERRWRVKYQAKQEVKDRLVHRYGITVDQYKEMLEKQKNLCAICKKSKEEKLSVDHCHKTKKVRGLLCGSCNRGLGMFMDDIDLLRNAIEYLCNIEKPPQ